MGSCGCFCWGTLLLLFDFVDLDSEGVQFGEDAGHDVAIIGGGIGHVVEIAGNGTGVLVGDTVGSTKGKWVGFEEPLTLDVGEAVLQLPRWPRFVGGGRGLGAMPILYRCRI